MIPAAAFFYSSHAFNRCFLLADLNAESHDSRFVKRDQYLCPTVHELASVRSVTFNILIHVTVINTRRDDTDIKKKTS